MRKKKFLTESTTNIVFRGLIRMINQSLLTRILQHVFAVLKVTCLYRQTDLIIVSYNVQHLHVSVEELSI